MYGQEAVAILTAATLVVGAGTLATTTPLSAAYAYKKGSQNSSSKNGNTVIQQKHKQDGTQSGFDNLIEQEDLNVICTHPGNNATCSQEGAAVPTTPPLPTTGTLLVKKIVNCLVSTPCHPASDFTITVTGNNPTPASSKGSESGTLVTLGPGTYTVSEPVPSPVVFGAHILSGDCEITAPGFHSSTGTISAN